MTGILAGLLSFSFAGGDVGEFAQAVNDWTKRPVVALVQTRRLRPWSTGGQNLPPEFAGPPPVPKFELGLKEVGDGKDFRRLVRVKGDTQVSSGSGIGIWQPGWESETLRPMTSRTLPPGWVQDGGSGVKFKDGTVSVSLRPRTLVTVDQIASLPWSKPVEVFWLYRPMFVTSVAKGASERAFLEALAAAVGATLRESKERWSLDFNVQELRLRAQEFAKRIEVQDFSPGLAAARKDLLVAAWRQIPDEDIRQVFRAPKQSRAVSVPQNTPLYASLGRYLKAHFVFSQAPPRGMEQVAEGQRDRLSRVNYSRPFQVFIGQNLGVGGGYPREGGGTIIL